MFDDSVETTPLSTRPVLDVLDEILSQAGWASRQGQRDMATASAALLQGGPGRQVVVEAGTGTGKSLAYSAAAAAAGGADGDPFSGEGRTVIITATKALQTQLEVKDLPLVQEVTGMRFSKLVGLSNYVCLAKVADVLETRKTGGHSQRQGVLNVEEDVPLDIEDSVDEFDELLEFLSERGVSGERGDLPFEPSQQLWKQVSCSAGECTGGSCSKAEECYALDARAEAKSAPVVIVNAALYASHLAVVTASEDDSGDSGYAAGILGPHDRLIVDEAHKFADAIISAQTIDLPVQVMRGAYNAYASVVKNPQAMNVANGLTDRFEFATQSHRNKWFTAGTLPDAISEVLQDMAAVIAGWRKEVKGTNPVTEAASDRRVRAMKTLANRDDLFDDITDPEDVYLWCDDAGAIKATPKSVAGFLRDNLWPGVAAVLCSATIPMDLAATLGLTDVQYASAESPFHYPSQAVLYVPRMPPATKDHRDEHFAACVDQVEALMRAAGGRTTSLHTSRKAMLDMAEKLRERLADTDIEILCQDELPRTELLERVMAKPETCLVATSGMWEGISIDGDTNICVTIDRLPFAPPGDPVGQARKAAAGANWFAPIIASTSMMLAQAVGRLVRGVDDRGVVAVLDPRLADKRAKYKYRHKILAQLPRMGRTRELGEVVGMLEALVKDPTATISVDEGAITMVPTPDRGGL